MSFEIVAVTMFPLRNKLLMLLEAFLYILFFLILLRYVNDVLSIKKLKFVFQKIFPAVKITDFFKLQMIFLVSLAIKQLYD